MPPKQQHIEQPLDQGMLFPVDASNEHSTIIGEPLEGGMYPEDLPPTEVDAATRHFHEAVHVAVEAEQLTRKRREAQLGKHSPLERDGTYLGTKPGDVLPGFGIVTKTNLDAALVHAQGLEETRLAELALQPVLGSATNDDVQEIVEETADALDIRHGLGLPGKPPKDRELATTQIKLEALRDSADFLPTNHREKTTGHVLLDFMIPGRHEKGVSSYLDKIYFKQQRDMQKLNGMTPREAQAVATDTVRSIIREWGDYYQDARQSWSKLNNLQRLTGGILPKLSIDELLADQGNGETLAQMVRFNALRQLRDTDKPLGFDPLWVHEDRTQPTEAKHKTVEDVFTHDNETFMAAYVHYRMRSMTAGQIYAGILEAKRDQANRGKFWRGVIESLNEDYKQYADLALQPVA